MKISIITPTLNSVDTIRTTLESILNQKYYNFEIIIVDGGSTDGTQAVLAGYAPLFEGRLSWISEPDKGLYDAMNKGLQKATGEVVGILNSDDYYHRDDFLCIISNSFSLHPEIQAIYGDVRYVNPGNLNKTVRFCNGSRFRLWKMRWGWFPAHPTFFTYKNNYEKYGYYHENYEIAADYELIIRFLYTNHLPASYVPHDVLTMRTGGKTYGGMKTMRLINQEKKRACKENGLYTNTLMLMTRYVGKVLELIVRR